jgi:hypothetical protein
MVKCYGGTNFGETIFAGRNRDFMTVSLPPIIVNSLSLVLTIGEVCMCRPYSFEFSQWTPSLGPGHGESSG